MIGRVGAWMTRAVRRVMPDPFVLALLLTLLVLVAGYAAIDGSPAERLGVLADGWFASYKSPGLMKFALQMCTVLLTGHALAVSTPVRAAISKLAGFVHTPGAAVVAVALVSAGASLVQWGLGVIVGAFMAREVGRAMAARAIPVHYPLLGAAGYAGFTVWHGGLSGSAPLKVASPGHIAADLVGVLPMSQTVFSTMNLAITGALLVVIPLTLWAMHPKERDDMTPFVLREQDAGRGVEPALHEPAPSLWIHVLERTPVVNIGAALVLSAWIVRHFATLGTAGWTFDVVNVIFLALGLLMHRSPAAYAGAIAHGARGCAGILLQFPFYFGILGVLKASGLIGTIAGAFAAASSPTTLPALTFLSAGLVNLAVPSGGGQWVVQGPVVMQAAVDLGVDPVKVLMALAYGDSWTNLIQPFWALPLLGIMGLKAQDIIGYTTVALASTGAVILGLLLFF
ncbi:MAG: TIGR00366 family protein [Myxococcota bacterium]